MSPSDIVASKVKTKFMVPAGASDVTMALLLTLEKIFPGANLFCNNAGSLEYTKVRNFMST
jgi:hypothetical protein